MRLLLDAGHAPAAARRLRGAGYDVLAAADDPRLAGLPDNELLRFATAEDRVVVTENARDFEQILRTWATTGEHHGGVVLTSPRRFHRARLGYPEDLIVALRKLLSEAAPDQHDQVRWLEVP